MAPALGGGGEGEVANNLHPLSWRDGRDHKFDLLFYYYRLVEQITEFKKANSGLNF